MSSKNCKHHFCAGIFILFFGASAFAQSLPIGLSEGFMGNSGAAITDSSAPSYYNPSLLGEKSTDSFTLSGTTFNNLASKTDSSSYSALNVTPSYLSTIHTGENVNHELFFINLGSGSYRLTGGSGSNIAGAVPTDFTSNLNLSQDVMGYSLAFKSFPFAMQFAFQYQEASQIGYFSSTNTSANSHTNGQMSSEYKKLDFSMGLSTHIRFENYTFAVNYLSRGLQLYKSRNSTNKIFVTDNGAYSESETHDGGASVTPKGQSLIIGHGFRVGRHEFLTDTNLREDGGNLNSYSTNQSFGYRYISNRQRQFFCGVNHQISDRIRYFGQNLYASTGFSWLSGGLRSAMGIFYYNDNLGDKTTAYGVNFASEFRY